MNPNHIQSQLKPQKALIIGDIMVDRYITGKVSRISPEAPIPILDMEKHEDRPGGAANVALNLKNLKCESVLLSVVGEDENGKILKSLLDSKGINTNYLVHSSHRITTVKSRIMAGWQHLLRVDNENSRDLREEELLQFGSNLNLVLDDLDIDFIIFQDYNKGVLTKKSIQICIDLALEKKIPTFVDPKVANFYAYTGVTVFKPNFREFQKALPFEVEIEENSLIKGAEYLHRALKCNKILVTLGSKGLFLYEPTGFQWLKGRSVEVADVCGAGDTIISCFSSLYAHFDLNTNLAFANYAASTVCQHPGVVPFSFDLNSVK